MSWIPTFPSTRCGSWSSAWRSRLLRRRFSLQLLGAFAALALGLAGIGTYGVMAFLVNQGTREIGIRMALGATSGAILAMVLRRAMCAGGDGDRNWTRGGYSAGAPLADDAVRRAAKVTRSLSPRHPFYWARWRCWPDIYLRGGRPGLSR